MTIVDFKKGVDYIGICVTFFCHDGTGRFVMNKRGVRCRDEHGCWDFGSGALKLGETLEQALQREVNDEYCADIIRTEYLGYREALRNQAQPPTHWIAFDFAVLVNPATVANGEPHVLDEVRWCTRDTIPEPLHSQLPVFFNNYQQQLERFMRPAAL